MPYDLPPLPYDADALEPHISLKTMKLHYGKHHQGYVDKLNAITNGTDLDGKDLKTIIRTARKNSDQYLFNNAAQVWNHNFFWQSMAKASSEPSDRLKAEIEKAFDGMDGFNQAFKETATSEFGSGWAWLNATKDGLEVMSTTDAETPIANGENPLICCDVWEHAYYLDYQNERGDFIGVFLDNLVNWKFASENLEIFNSPDRVTAE